MAITATFYKNNKRVNSTKLPITQAGTISMYVELKDVTNLFTPSLVISADRFKVGEKITNPMQYNYCYIADFERYYFVRSWSWVLGRWECSLEVDVLASFRNAIGNTTAYVLRSASAWDGNIIDTKYPVKAEDAKQPYQIKTYTTDLITSPWNTNIYNANVQEGCFVISVVNNDAGAIGGTSHYALAPRVMAELLNKLYSSPSWMNITDGNISQDLQKMLINPMQYITNAMWIPCGYDVSGAVGISVLPYGWWSVTLTSGVAYRVDVAHVKNDISLSFSVASHPQKDTAKQWLQMSPFTTAALYLPPFGMISLDTSKIFGADTIDCAISVDLITGRGVLTISSHRTEGSTRIAGGVIYTTTAQVGVPVSVAQMSVDFDKLSSASTWIGAAGIALGNGGIQNAVGKLSAPATKANGASLGAIAGLAGGSTVHYSSSGNVFGGSHGSFGNYQGVSGYLREIGDDIGNSIAGMKSGINGAISDIKGAVNAVQGAVEDIKGAIPSLLETVKSTAADIGSAALSISGTCQSTGSTGGFAALMETCYVQWYFQRIVDQDAVHYGYPLCQNRKINTLSGFVLCANEGDLEVSATPAERQTIISLMEAGFYYE